MFNRGCARVQQGRGTAHLLIGRDRGTISATSGTAYIILLMYSLAISSSLCSAIPPARAIAARPPDATTLLRVVATLVPPSVDHSHHRTIRIPPQV